MQVVTSENFAQLVETGKVPEFKAPVTEPEKVEVKEEVKEVEKVSFKKADGSEVAFEKKAEKAEDSAVDDDPEDKDLPERVRKQIGKKHRQMKEAEETARQWWADKTAAEQRAEKAERELQALKAPKSGPATGEPKPGDFKTNAEYIDAMVDWKFQKKEQDEQTRRHEAEQAKAQAEFIDRLNAVRKEIPDFDEVTGEADIDVVPHVASYIAESPLGPKLGYHFAKNPDELERIQKLSPIRAIAELGKLEIKLEKKPEPETVKAEPKAEVSKAPSPITPIDASSKAVVQKDPAKMTLQELREYDRQQREAKRR